MVWFSSAPLVYIAAALEFQVSISFCAVQLKYFRDTPIRLGARLRPFYKATKYFVGRAST